MRYKLLGRSGLRVSEISLGAMTFGEEWGFGSSKEESRKVFDAYAAAGGNFIDTANHYTEGTSEKWVGEFVGAERDRFVVATKFTLNPRPKDPNAGGNQRKNLVRALEASLRRLGTDYVDLYWVHAWDPLTPAEELMRALDDVVRAGKVLYVGISDAPAWVVSRANALADLRGWTAFAGIQIQWSLMERTPERELVPMAEALDLAIAAWGPLGGGILSGKYKRGAERPKDARYVEGPWAEKFVVDRNLAIAEAVEAVAKDVGRSPSQVAINWLRQQGRGVVIPIVGARKVAQIEDNLGCLEWRLSAGELARLDAASAIPLGFPHDFLAMDMVQTAIYGETRQLIDVHRRGGA